MPTSPTPNLDAIANAAGVSTMTVSRVLRNAPNVSPETRDRVLTAVRSLNYQPDPHLARMMQLLHHEFGIPAVPRQILISPEWVDGASVRSVC